jgi:hypothetical protein
LAIAMSIYRNEQGLALVPVLILAALVLLAVGVAFYRVSHRTTVSGSPGEGGAGAKLSPSRSPTAADPYAGWETSKMAGSDLALRRPDTWQESTDTDTDGLKLTRQTSGGQLIIRLYYPTPAEIANASATADFKPVSSFSFSGRQAYVVEDNVGGMYDLSSCAAPRLCFFSDRGQPRYGIDMYLTFWPTGGAQDEVVLPSDPADLAEAAKVMSTISY